MWDGGSSEERPVILGVFCFHDIITVLKEKGTLRPQRDSRS